MTRIISTKVPDTTHAALVERYGTIYSALQHAIRLALDGEPDPVTPTPRPVKREPETPHPTPTQPPTGKHWHKRVTLLNTRFEGGRKVERWACSCGSELD